MTFGEPQRRYGADDVCIRRMREEDIPFAAELSARCMEEAWREADFLESLLQDCALLFTAVKKGVPVGYAVFYTAADQAELESIAVRHEQRRQGIAARLLASASAELLARGVASVTLEVREGNEAARRLYETFGFRTLGRRKNFYRSPQEDALILGSNLR